MTERTIDQPYTPPTIASSITTKYCPVDRNSEYNSLYAIHRIGMEFGWWWWDAVQISVCSCLQYRYEQAIVVYDLSD